MKVELLYHTPLSVSVVAGRTCWQSFHKGGCYAEPTDDISDTDKEFLDRIVNKNKHQSVIEHINYNFSVKGISRACLQELARHRLASLSVKSTRYTLKELAKEDSFEAISELGNLTQNEVCKLWDRASKYLVLTTEPACIVTQIMMLEQLRLIILRGVTNDITKYALPESYKTDLVWSINARSLMNFINLRTSKAALWEIRDLANEVFRSLPSKHKFLFESYRKEV